jgi:magnesium-transporting ATPase (P-type)
VVGHLIYGLKPFAEDLGLAAMTLDQLRAIPHLSGITKLFTEMTPEEQAHTIELALDLPRTMAFTILAFTQVAEVTAIHAGDVSFFRIGYGKNWLLRLSVFIIVLLQLAVIYVPFLQDLFHTTALPIELLVVCVGLSSILFFLVEIEKFIRRQRATSAA